MRDNPIKLTNYLNAKRKKEKPMEYYLRTKEDALNISDETCQFCKEYEAIIKSPQFTDDMRVIMFGWHIVGVM